MCSRRRIHPTNNDVTAFVVYDICFVGNLQVTQNYFPASLRDLAHHNADAREFRGLGDNE